MATTINQISPRCLAPWELHISACAAQGGDLLSVCRQQLVSGAICLASCDDAELSVMPPCRGSVCRGPAPLSSCTLQCKQGHVTQTFYTHTHFCVVTVDRDPSLSFNDRVSVICFQKYTLEDTRDSFGGQGSRSALVSCFRPVDVLCNSCVFMLSVKAAPSLFAPTLKWRTPCVFFVRSLEGDGSGPYPVECGYVLSAHHCS